MPKRKPKPAKPDNRLKIKKVRNPNPPPPPKEYQFKPGQSGNPGGRPKVLSSAYRQWLETINVNDPEGRTNAELVARSMGLQSLKGNINAAREMRSATEGDKIAIIDWRAQAHEAGYDPEELYNRLVAAGRAAVDASGDRRSGPDGHSDSGPAVDAVPADAPSETD